MTPWNSCTFFSQMGYLTWLDKFFQTFSHYILLPCSALILHSILTGTTATRNALTVFDLMLR